MILKSTQFNHDADNFHEAMQLSEFLRIKCRERVFFATMANSIQGNDLYGDKDNTPVEFHTKTGDLARTLSLIDDQFEYEYTLLMFTKLQDAASEASHHYLAMYDENVPKYKRMMMKAMMLQEEETNDEDGPSVANPVTALSLLKRAELVKKSQYNWSSYYSTVKANNYFMPHAATSDNSEFDVDGMINDLLN